MRPGPLMSVDYKLPTGIMDLLPKTKYNHLRNESVSSAEDAPGTGPPTPSVDIMESLPSSSSSSSLAPMLNLAELSSESEDSPTTLCSFFPKMANLKLSNPASLLSLRGFSTGIPGGAVNETGSPAGAVIETGSPGGPGKETGGICGSTDDSPDSGRTFTVFSQDMNKLSCGRKVRVEGGQLAGDEWTRHGSFVNKPTRGWLHPDDKVMGAGVPYLVRYMGCVEVLQSMRALDFSTRTQVTREAISLVSDAVPGAKGALRRRKTGGRSLNSILGKCNLKFAGMPITLTVSTSSLNLMASDCKQIIANHHMQSISFASGGDPDTAEYVAYVAKDPVNQRACHILECPEGLAQDVISTIGQAFELRFKQYLKNPPKLVTPHDRMAGFDGSAWDEEEEEIPDHAYYNDFPGKEPPIGGVVDMRLREGTAPSVPRQSPNHMGATLPVGQIPGADQDARKLQPHPPVQEPFEDTIPPSVSFVTMEEQLKRELWYHGNMTRKDAERQLKVNGDFLVRESTTTPGQYVLTGLQNGQPKHLLLVDPEGVVRTKDHRFESVSHLISYHMDNHLPIISAGSELCLQQPVERRP
ncbi:SHC-transforming protein 1 isoform X2 [Ranitomeya variabilis]|uniref:SHC-transforming protein 1 isoform X2 n=2 Tax=Ranitomeya variabilis TaxID=490064 RepID=UPI00405747C3